MYEDYSSGGLIIKLKPRVMSFSPAATYIVLRSFVSMASPFIVDGTHVYIVPKNHLVMNLIYFIVFRS